MGPVHNFDDIWFMFVVGYQIPFFVHGHFISNLKRFFTGVVAGATVDWAGGWTGRRGRRRRRRRSNSQILLSTAGKGQGMLVRCRI